jgi:hypothetical protein
MKQGSMKQMLRSSTGVSDHEVMMGLSALEHLTCT